MTCPRGASRDSPGMKQVGGRQGAPRFLWPPAAPPPHGSWPCLWSVSPPPLTRVLVSTLESCSVSSNMFY